MMLSNIALTLIARAATLVAASQSGHLSKRNDCWTYKNGAFLSPRAGSTGCAEGQHAVKQDGQVYCFASWINNQPDGQQQKTCMPSADDCRGLAKQISDSTRDGDDLLIRWRSGSGQRSPLDFSTKKGDTCIAVPTVYGTCRFDLYVDEPLADNDTKEFGTLRLDMVSSLMAAAQFFPGADPDKPNSEVEIFQNEGTYTQAKYVVEFPHATLKARVWFPPEHADCKAKCGAIEGYCK